MQSRWRDSLAALHADAVLTAVQPVERSRQAVDPLHQELACREADFPTNAALAHVEVVTLGGRDDLLLLDGIGLTKPADN